MSNELYKIRGMLESDIPFIYDTWMKCMETSSPIGRLMHARVYKKNLRAMIDGILKISQVSIACNPEDPDQVYGYVVHRMLHSIPVISFVHVKHTFRNMRICANLLIPITEGKACIATSKHEYLGRVFRKYNIVYNPFIDFKLIGDSLELLC